MTTIKMTMMMSSLRSPDAKLAASRRLLLCHHLPLLPFFGVCRSTAAGSSSSSSRISSSSTGSSSIHHNHHHQHHRTPPCPTAARRTSSSSIHSGNPSHRESASSSSSSSSSSSPSGRQRATVVVANSRNKLAAGLLRGGGGAGEADGAAAGSTSTTGRSVAHSLSSVKGNVELYSNAHNKVFWLLYVTGSLHLLLWTGAGYVYHQTMQQKQLDRVLQREALGVETLPDDAAEWWLRTPFVRAATVALSSIGVALFAKVHVYAGSYIRSLRVVDGGRTVAIRNGRLFGRREVRVPADAVYTTKRAFTGHGPTLTDVPVPQGLPWYRDAVFQLSELAVPLRVAAAAAPSSSSSSSSSGRSGGRGVRWSQSFKVDRSGQFLNAKLWDEFFYRGGAEGGR
ncbi:hypothetical protein DFJ73DRAFT_139739 [Zopfochytrium polystomum]|nr:hypothetical protein DFJ73DRAFT_139739 [Zopfochytrium polystomum]